MTADELAEMIDLEQHASPPPLYAESAYLLEREGLEHRYRVEMTPADIKLFLMTRQHMERIIRELQDGRAGQLKGRIS
ncbi:MAG: hypothetical protein ACR2RL_21555 [Gammaproteobacteria bacterium]